MKINPFPRSIRYFLSVISLAAWQSAYTQELLELNIEHRCVFTGSKMDEELYRFSADDGMAKRVEEILTLGGALSNFEVVQTNVENVSAVLDGEKRYLLYSLDFVQKATEIEITGALAHEIGHHVNEHTFDPEHRNSEENEADQFMGYIFSLKAYSKADIETCLNKTPSSYNIGVEDRLQAVWEGFNRAERVLEINSLAFDGDPRLAELTMPGFPWPPPSCHSRFELPEKLFSGIKTLGETDRKIRSALNAKGYTQYSYFSVPGGFAIVTQLEQYNGEDGSSRNDRTRWLDYPARDNFNGVMDYLKSLVMPQKGHFRLFVFIVTNQPFGGGANRVSKAQATAWLSQGFNKLPGSLAKVPFSSDYNVTALVYEFEVPETNRKPIQRCPSPLFDARTHLLKVGILTGLGF
ncbi:MAG: hypothetical protein IPJ82_15255 [Lewinellaceae bacterium]|nr:hypothetical protein [Lewinellaceae bacterium]